MKKLPLENEHFIELEKLFKDWLAALGYADTTVKTSPVQLRELFHFLEGQGIEAIQEVTQSHLQAFMAHLWGRPHQTEGGSLSESYIAKYWQTLGNFNRYLQQTQTASLALPKGQIRVEQNIKTILTQTEIKKLYQTCTDSILGIRDRAMLAVFYGCGLRRSEGIGLDVDDVLFGRGLIYVRKGKNYKERYVPMSENVATDLERYLKESRPYLLIKPTNALLVSGKGLRINDRTLTIRIRKLQQSSHDVILAAKAISLHSLRHSIATHLLQNGMKLKQIALFLGHASIESTQIYTQLVEKA